MNDVAHPSLVTVKRPITMLPFDFKQAIADLATAGHIGVQLVAGDHAVVERRVVAEVPLERELAAEDVRDAFLDVADAQAGPPLDHPASKVEKTVRLRPRSQKHNGGGNDRAAPLKERTVIRSVSLVDAIVCGVLKGFAR